MFSAKTSILSGLDLAEVEHVVDQPEKVLGVGLDLAEVGEHRLLAHVLDLLLQHLAVADHGRQRGPQLVAHVGQERALGPVGGLGRFLGGREREFGLLALGDVGVRADPLADRAVLLQDGRDAERHVAPLAIGAAHAVFQRDRARRWQCAFRHAARVRSTSSGWMHASRPQPSDVASGCPVKRVQFGCGLAKVPVASAVQIIAALASTRLRNRSSLSLVARSARLRAVTSAITMPTPSTSLRRALLQRIEVGLVGPDLIDARVAGRLDLGAGSAAALKTR